MQKIDPVTLWDVLTCAPCGPESPGQPGGPGSPVDPLLPFSPLKPGPGEPGGPWMPGGPVEKETQIWNAVWWVWCSSESLNCYRKNTRSYFTQDHFNQTFFPCVFTIDNYNLSLCSGSSLLFHKPQWKALSRESTIPTMFHVLTWNSLGEAIERFPTM